MQFSSPKCCKSTCLGPWTYHSHHYISACVSCYYWKMCKCLGSGQNMIPLVPEGYVSAQGNTDWDGLCYNPGPSWCLGLSCDLKPFPGLWTCSNWIAALMEIGERLVSEAFFFVCSFLFFFFSFCLILNQYIPIWNFYFLINFYFIFLNLSFSFLLVKDTTRVKDR